MTVKFPFLTLVILFVDTGAAFAATAGYVCEDKTQLVASFTPPAESLGSVSLAIDGQSEAVVLPQVLSADGGRYADEVMEFWIKGRDATLTRDGKSQTCHGQ